MIALLHPSSTRREQLPIGSRRSASHGAPTIANTPCALMRQFAAAEARRPLRAARAFRRHAEPLCASRAHARDRPCSFDSCQDDARRPCRDQDLVRVPVQSSKLFWNTNRTCTLSMYGVASKIRGVLFYEAPAGTRGPWCLPCDGNAPTSPDLLT
jgi:hypothetical protein